MADNGARGVKRKAEFQTLEELIETPWCYYCDRTFSDGKVLHDHQKAKHFQCSVGGCHRRLNTAGGLRVHMQQVHKEELHSVDNALDGRRDPNIEIFGMVGIPENIHEERVAALTQEYQRLQREHRRKTGNPLPGEVKDNANTSVSKTQQLTEGMSDLKARVAAAKAKKEAEKAAKAAGGLPPTTTTLTPQTSSMALNGSATPEVMSDAQRNASQSSPAPGTFNGAVPPNFPGSPLSWTGNAPPFAPQVPGVPGAPGYANGTHSSPPPQWAQQMPVNPYSQPPQPQFQSNYAPPQPMLHNGANNGYHANPPFAAPPRQQHALPVLPPMPAGLPQRPSFAPQPQPQRPGHNGLPQHPGHNGLPQHPGHFNGQAPPAPGTFVSRAADTPGKPLLQHTIYDICDETDTMIAASDPSENAKRAQLAEDFLTQFSADNNVAAPATVESSAPQSQTTAVATPPQLPQPSAAQPASTVKSKKSNNEKAKMKISDTVSTWEENRAQAPRYQKAEAAAS